MENQSNGLLNPHKELLECVMLISVSSRDTIGKLIKHCVNETFRYELAAAFAEFQAIIEEAGALSQRFNSFEKQEAVCYRRPRLHALSLNLLLNKSPSHIAELVIQHSITNVIDIKRTQKAVNNAAWEIKNICERLLSAEQHMIGRMLNFV